MRNCDKRILEEKLVVKMYRNGMSKDNVKSSWVFEKIGTREFWRTNWLWNLVIVFCKVQPMSLIWWKPSQYLYLAFLEYLSKLLKIFVQIAKSICLNWSLYLEKINMGLVNAFPVFVLGIPWISQVLTLLHQSQIPPLQSHCFSSHWKFYYGWELQEMYL